MRLNNECIEHFTKYIITSSTTTTTTNNNY